MSLDEKILKEGILLLQEGKPLIFPTDTVYGLGIAVDYSTSPQILYDLKQRSDTKPIAWLVDGVDALKKYSAETPEYVYDFAQTFWPGPLTLIVKANNEVPPAFCSKEGTVALRMPKDSLALALIRQAGSPLAVTSANIAGQAAPHVLSEVNPVLINAVPLALGDEVERSGVASTVVDCTDAYPVVVRKGGIAQISLEAILTSKAK